MVCRAVAAMMAAGMGWAENWPMFRGPTGLGYTSERELPVRWGGEGRENVLWAAPLVGEGHASPIVWEDRVFVSTVAWARAGGNTLLLGDPSPSVAERRVATIQSHGERSIQRVGSRLSWKMARMVMQSSPGT